MKILILNQPFDNNTGGGITLSNLFDGIDPDKVAVVCPAQLINSKTNFEKCNHYYQLGVLEQKWSFPFNLVRTQNPSGEVSSQKQNDGNLDFVSSEGSFKSRMVNDVFFPTIKYLGIHQAVYRLELSKELIDWINDFEPTLIYAQAQNFQEVSFCQSIKDEFDIPFVFHMMDDWISLASQSGISKFLWKKRTEYEFKKLLQESERVFSISDFMSTEYYSRYNVNSDVFHNPVDEGFWMQHQKNDMTLNENPKILYAGRVGLGIDTSLILMARAVEKLNKSFNTNVNFVVQTESKPNWIDEFESVIYRELVPYSELPLTFSRADLLYLPYDFSKESIEFIKYSMPTKASEYMICGTPILILAPKDTAIVMNALKYGWASVLTENSQVDLVNSLKELLFEPITRANLSQNAIEVAIDQHSKTVVQNRFFKILHEISKPTK